VVADVYCPESAALAVRSSPVFLLPVEGKAAAQAVEAVLDNQILPLMERLIMVLLAEVAAVLVVVPITPTIWEAVAAGGEHPVDLIKEQAAAAERL
jgi:hypothetical protein